MKKFLIKPYLWVFTLYFMQGMPYAIVMLLSSILLKQFGFSNSQIAFYTSLFILPWVIKFFFAPFLEKISTKRTLILANETGLAVISLLIALLLYLHWIKLAAALFFMMALVASWHDITTDGFYLVSLNPTQQLNYVGLRTLAFQFARLFCQGVVVIAIGYLLYLLSLKNSWAIAFIFFAILIMLFVIFHARVLPFPEDQQVKKILRVGEDNSAESLSLQVLSRDHSAKSIDVFKIFFSIPKILPIIFFIFFYNVAEAQLIKIVPLFLLDPIVAGGLQMDIKQVGFLYGVCGLVAMLTGIFLSIWLIKLFGLKKCLIGATVALLCSQLGYLVISSNIGQKNLNLIIMVILLGQFCYGLSNNAYMVTLLGVARGHKHSMSFYAIITGIMGLGMMLPGAISGRIQHYLGYMNFFVWIVLLQGAVLWFTCKKISLFNHENTIPERTFAARS